MTFCRSMRRRRCREGGHRVEGGATQSPSVLGRRPFLLLWLSGVISNGGDWILLVALPVYMYELTHSTLATGILVIAQSLPRLLFSLVAGVLVDRWDRRRTMIAATLGQGILLLLLLLVRSPDALPLAYAVAAAVATLALLVEPAASALIPRLVAADEVVAANGMRALGWELGRLTAPPLGGLLMVTSGLGGVALVDSASFALSAALLTALGASSAQAREHKRAAAGAGADRAARTTVRHDLGIGIGSVRESRLLVTVFTLAAITMVAEGIINVLSFPWIATVLHGSATERGWLATAQGVGGVAGGLAVRGLSHAAPGRVIGGSALLFGGVSLTLTNLALLPIAGGDRWPVALLLKGLSGAPLVVLAVGLQTVLVQSVADRVRGRVLAAYGGATSCALLVGQVLASTLGDRLGVVPVLSLQGVLYLIAGCVAFMVHPS